MQLILCYPAVNIARHHLKDQRCGSSSFSLAQPTPRNQRHEL